MPARCSHENFLNETRAAADKQLRIIVPAACPLPMASARAARQLAAMVCRPPSVRACAGTASRAVGRTGPVPNPGGGTHAQQAIRRLLAGESVAVGSVGGRAASTSARLSSARCLAAALGPLGTKQALALAKTLLHDYQEDMALIDDGDMEEDT